ncbi:hypothetical protein AMJ39_01225 [candidate division TA06 bacterium DG_24]|uniref:4Fe-4S ferredoxin-type domain-containing protein n=3 Tax=Bacteria division TA06 TaxID=1156500 RepID=A0A0S8JJV0_UNCT6|nr:MAG: hypothetical protein AMJ39_01225 [candidate division TA06 bacterium DG_24]KPK68912.1 MAG: hypothetical protein AMJ82_06975 [candidate division TA06 bacterium SM23_40]KPL09021.1 MAG: hypothetical protein AMJ71_07545 [candidate division TA06 bacterium SM1_40]
MGPGSLRSAAEAGADQLRIGVFVCHCGTNIAGFLDVDAVAREAGASPGVVYSVTTMYACSESGLKEISESIRKHNLNRVVIAACSPRTHEPLFREVCGEAGLNPYLVEMANIRNQCSWVHMDDKERATKKAAALVRMAVAKAARLGPREPIEVDVDRRAVVIGGGIAGMNAALDLGDAGFDTVLIEREPDLGGRLRGLYRLYPSGREAREVLEEFIPRVIEHRHIEVLTATELTGVRGFIGNYVLTVRTGGDERELEAGVIVVASGADVLEPHGLFGYDGERVITQLELARRMSQGSVEAGTIVMIQCVGARLPEREYCSRVCCANAIKNASMLVEEDSGRSVYVLYRDIQGYGTEFEDWFARAREAGVVFARYDPERPPLVDSRGVRIYDLLLGEEVLLPADLIVLSTPMVARPDARSLGQMLRVPVDKDGFFLEAHVKLRPVDFATEGMFLCGAARWPCRISEACAQASAAASRALVPLVNGKVVVEPVVVDIDEAICRGCGLCRDLCRYAAIEMVENERGLAVARVNQVLCKGCGVCAARCPSGAMTLFHFTDEQIRAMLRAARPALLAGARHGDEGGSAGGVR